MVAIVPKTLCLLAPPARPSFSTACLRLAPPLARFSPQSAVLRDCLADASRLGPEFPSPIRDSPAGVSGGTRQSLQLRAWTDPLLFSLPPQTDSCCAPNPLRCPFGEGELLSNGNR